MKNRVHVLLVISAVAFLVGVVGNLIQLFGAESAQILWPPITWWRGAMGAGLYAMIFALVDVRQALGSGS